MTANDDRAGERRDMVREIEGEFRWMRAAGAGIPALSERVRAAIEAVPRHRFMPGRCAAAAYENRPLPIGDGQTISQPFIVALMTTLLEPAPDDVVLEIGTGSGYQAAVLSHLAGAVFTVEVIESLGRAAETALRASGCENVEVRIDDGSGGWLERAPFDAIIVTAAAGEVPEALVDQLAPGGRMVLPVGPAHGPQELLRLRRDAAGTVRQEPIIPVAFVPLVHPSGAGPGGADTDDETGERI